MQKFVSRRKTGDTGLRPCLACKLMHSFKYTHLKTLITRPGRSNRVQSHQGRQENLLWAAWRGHEVKASNEDLGFGDLLMLAKRIRCTMPTAIFTCFWKISAKGDQYNLKLLLGNVASGHGTRLLPTTFTRVRLILT